MRTLRKPFYQGLYQAGFFHCWGAPTIGLPEGMVNSHSKRPQGRAVVQSGVSLLELVCLQYSHLCPIGEEQLSFKQAYWKGMRNVWASMNYCHPVTKETHHTALIKGGISSHKCLKAKKLLVTTTEYIVKIHLKMQVYFCLYLLEGLPCCQEPWHL